MPGARYEYVLENLLNVCRHDWEFNVYKGEGALQLTVHILHKS